MKQQNLRIRFIISGTRKRQDNRVPLICRLTLSGTRKQFYTGIYIKRSSWDSKRQIIKKSEDDYLNENLRYIEQKINQAYLSLKLNDSPFTVDKIYSVYKGEKAPESHKLLETYKVYLARRKQVIGSDITLTTYKKDIETFNHLKLYIEKEYKGNDPLFTDLKIKFLNDLEHYLKTKADLQQATVNKTIQRFRRLINFAVSQEFLKNDPFIQFKYGTYTKEVVYLTKEELKRLEEHNFEIERISRIRDLFVFCCYSGLPFKEMEGLKHLNIIDRNGLFWLAIKRKKTGNQYTLPLLNKAIHIIKKYHNPDEERVFPGISNQKFNAYLKEIADIVGIKKNLTHHIARKTFATTVLLSNGVPMDVVSRFLGHSNLKTTQNHYGKIIDSTLTTVARNLNTKL